MSVALLKCDYNTKYCEFSYENWEQDKNSLPTINSGGIGLDSCCQGSLAFGIDNTKRVLTNDGWVNISMYDKVYENIIISVPVQSIESIDGEV